MFDDVLNTVFIVFPPSSAVSRVRYVFTCMDYSLLPLIHLFFRCSLPIVAVLVRFSAQLSAVGCVVCRVCSLLVAAADSSHSRALLACFAHRSLIALLSLSRAQPPPSSSPSNWLDSRAVSVSLDRSRRISPIALFALFYVFFSFFLSFYTNILALA